VLQQFNKLKHTAADVTFLSMTHATNIDIAAHSTKIGLVSLAVHDKMILPVMDTLLT
jgi:hypothetical protein